MHEWKWNELKLEAKNIWLFKKNNLWNQIPATMSLSFQMSLKPNLDVNVVHKSLRQTPSSMGIAAEAPKLNLLTTIEI